MGILKLMAYTWEEIKFMEKEWWKKVPFKEKVRGLVPVVVVALEQAGRKALPMLAIVAIKAARLAGMKGFKALDWRFWGVNIQLVVGWVLGWVLADIDNIFYVLTCDPKEETCQRVKREVDLRRWKGGWKILQMTAGEREKLPIRNIFTLLLVEILGMWIITSTASVVGMGLVFGLGARLILELWQEKDFKKWYWIFKREFSLIEHKMVRLVLTGLWVYLAFGVVRV